jgi:prepilin-type N-terminal cleavage/methylation domain-containing protein
MASRGFTLMELLVGMTIFLVIMLSVTLMFNAVVRTSKIGYQNQTAYQVVRGVFDTIEQDISRAYTSRETGLKDTFYGTPYGFTFIGMVDSDGDEEFNLSRITYVMYSESYDAFPLDNTNDPLRIVHQSTADEYADSEERVTYALLRYIEPGVDNLDSFPINWAEDFDDDNLGLGYNLQDDFIDVAPNNVCDGTLECVELFERSLKCELWIRMLAGDPRVPRFWGEGSPVRMGTVAFVDQDMDPADYVLAENILHIDRLTDVDIAALPFPNRTIPPTQYDPTDYDTYTALTRADFPLIDSGANLADKALVDLTEASLDFIDFNTYKPLSDMPLDYFFTYRDGGEIIDGQTKLDLVGTDTGVPYTTLTSRDFVYWNDVRNQEFNIGVNDTVIADNEVAALTGTDVPVAGIISTTPDLYDPALPESMQLQFTLFYPSPFPGAPDFEKTFTHQINLPTAYRRKQETLPTLQLRDID